MKEAAGEANLTVVAIILIGVIAAIVTPLINQTMQTTRDRTCCMNAGGKWNGNSCESGGNPGYNPSAYQACRNKVKTN